MAHALFVLVAVAVFSVTALLLTLAVLRPLRTLADAARRVGEGKAALAPSRNFVDEIQDLEASVAAMVDRLQAREVEIHERLLATQASNDELQRMNRALADTRQQLLQAERLAAVGRLSAGLAHEIGNPLTAILSLLDLVITGDLPPAQQADFLQRIRAENERIAAIVRGLLDFSRPDVTLVEATTGACSPVDVVDELVRFFEPQRRYAHVRLAVSGERPTCTVRMQAGALRQVLLNLFLNAADALEDSDSPGLVLVAFEANGGDVRILVEDDGPGVDAQVGDRLFEPFVTSKTERGGTGLGLSVCRGLVEAVGGKLDLERTGPQGTRFALTLPAA
jgi:signal transduction histidine kinase